MYAKLLLNNGFGVFDCTDKLILYRAWLTSIR